MYMLFTYCMTWIVYLLSVFLDWDTGILLVVLGTLLLTATGGALLLWELGTKHFDLEVQELVKNSLQTHALECGWDLIYDCSCTKTNHTFLEFKKLLPISGAPSHAEIPSSMHNLKWPTHIWRFQVDSPRAV